MLINSDILLHEVFIEDEILPKKEKEVLKLFIMLEHIIQFQEK